MSTNLNLTFLRLCLALVVSSLFVGCGPTTPLEAEMRSRIAGTYCTEQYTHILELTDSTYFNQRLFDSPLGTGQSYESCRGNYLLVFEEKAWHIRFSKDPKPQAVENCDGEFVLWNEEKGYVYGNEDSVMMPDLFDGQLLLKRACDE